MPDWTRELRTRLTGLRLSPAREHEIVEELSQHLDEVYTDRRAGGLPHEAAVAAALDEIDERDLLTHEMGTLAQAHRNAVPPPGSRAAGWLADSAQDVRYAIRTLGHSKGWSVIIVLLLALGIGANAALFTATDALLVAPLDLHDPDSLVRLRWAGRNDAVTDRSEYGFVRPLPDGTRVGASFSYAAYRELAAAAGELVDLFGCAPFDQLTVSIDGRVELASALTATGNYFRAAGVTATAGRLFGPDDDDPAAPPVAVISPRFWRSRFGGDPAVIGRVLRLNDIAVTIVGVTPAGFAGVQQPLAEPPDIIFPLGLETMVRASSGRAAESLAARPTAWWLQVMGRLRPGATPAHVEARLAGIFQRVARAGLDDYLRSLTEEQRGSSANRDRREVPELLVQSARRGLYDTLEEVWQTQTLLNAVVAVVLLIICANIANLMLSRGVGRRKELAVRLSLGASRGRLVRQLFTEALVLALAGAAGGLLVAWYGVRLLPPPASYADVLQGRTLAFSLFAAVFTSVGFGALPAWRATRVDANTGLKETAGTQSGRRGALASGLLVLQVGLSLVLLVGAGLFLQTLDRLRRVDVGFNPDGVLLVRVAPRLSGYDLPGATALYGRLLERFSDIPGVRGAALSQPALLSGNINSTDIYVAGRTSPEHHPDGREIYVVVVSPRFFEVMGIPVLRGRGLAEADDGTAPRVALVNEAAARRFFLQEDAIGARFGTRPDRASDTEVVGIVGDTKYVELREPAPPTMFVSYRQSQRAAAVLAVRADVAPAALEEAIRAVVGQEAPELPIAEIATQRQHIERRFAREKLFAQAWAAFGLVALLLAAVGLFGLMSYSVARRTSEMGIRLALGAQRRDVVGMVLRESLGLVAFGLAAGIGLTLASARIVSALLFEVPLYDAWTVGVASAVMVVVSAMAAYLPARRAGSIDPLTALRWE